jgi:TRAP transporter 4TM/12TM fusion protein
MIGKLESPAPAGPAEAERASSWSGRGVAMLLWGIATVLFHLYIVVAGLVPNLIDRPLHFLLALPWIFLFVETRSRLERWSGWLFAGAGALGALFIVIERDRLVEQYGALSGPLQHLVAFVLIIVALEMARRAIKFVLPLIAAIVLLYGYFGWLVPGEFGHAGLPVGYYLGTLTIAEGGLWSSLTGLSVETVAPFIILGAFISVGAAGEGFMAAATQLAGRLKAGAAKVAILASAMYGTISGVAAANTASTGMVTIPAMKRLGYPPALAAAVEAVASTGGQIMPPIMGAGIFVMAELLRTPYSELMLVATLPAFLFFGAAWFGVHHYAIRLNLRELDASALPGWARVARTAPFFLVPFGMLIWFLLFTSYTAAWAAALATGITALLLMADPNGRISLPTWLARLGAACIEAGRQVANIAAVLICASLIVGVFHMTGLGVKLTSLIISGSGGNLWAALLLTGLASLVLGMELPTTAAYVICVAVAGPALVELGLPELYAHFFIFWYALLCTITPPVCGNVFIAAGIAQTPWLPVAWRSMQLGLGLFLVPLGFVANPSLLQVASHPGLAILATAKVGLAVWLLSYAVIGPRGIVVLRLAAAVAGIAMLVLLPV